MKQFIYTTEYWNLTNNIQLNNHKQLQFSIRDVLSFKA